jgi:hypothetical protein
VGLITTRRWGINPQPTATLMYFKL